MSRTGKNPITIPEKVDVKIETLTNGSQLIIVKGPKGEQKLVCKKGIQAKVEDGKVIFVRENEEKLTKSMHGTFRALVNNLIVGVTEGFTKELDIVGVGYRANMQGDKLVLQVGYSHPVEIEPKSKETKIEVDKQTHIKIIGINRQEVGDLAAAIRDVRKPEPYKGKGIKYSNEVIRKKAGKSAAGGKK